MTESSHALNRALDHRAHLSSTVILLPPSWSDSSCGGEIAEAKRKRRNGGEGDYAKRFPLVSRAEAADVVVTAKKDPLRGSSRPFTQQV